VDTPGLHRKQGNRPAVSIISAALLLAGKELLMEFVFGGAADWLKGHWGVVGDFLASRWSGPILALIVGLLIFAVTRDSEASKKVGSDTEQLSKPIITVKSNPTLSLRHKAFAFENGEVDFHKISTDKKEDGSVDLCISGLTTRFTHNSSISNRTIKLLIGSTLLGAVSIPASASGTFEDMSATETFRIPAGIIESKLQVKVVLSEINNGVLRQYEIGTLDIEL
jgi:hypothetical protein